MLWQPSLPKHYLELTDDELTAAITARRRTLGDDLLILGHHYQQDDVIQHADLTGDSLKLSQMAADEAAKRGTKFIVFCGVHFMAETADILTDESVTVILPDLSAGCSMADMAEYDDVVDAWEEIGQASRQVRSPSPSGRGVRGEGESSFVDRKLLTFARELRKNQTDAEQLMWYMLRDRRLLDCKFRRQHPIGRFIIDFFCDDAHLAIELDGGQHNEQSARDYDDQRSNYLAEKGIEVLRFWNHEVLTETEAVLEAIVNALRERMDERGGTLTPSPSPRGRGGQDIQTQTVRVIPITYVNSTAAIKAFVGQHGGACCTSTNAEQVFQWALNGGTQPVADGERIKIIFLPDQHLGRNTASKFGFLTEVDEAAGAGASQTAVWNPRKERGGLTAEQIHNADVLLWAGHCSVHKLFRPEHVDQARKEFAERGGVTVLVHPECCKEVVDQADLAGSTEFIIRQIENAPSGSNWAIGTEVHLVNRLATAAKKRGVNVRMLSDCQCLCTTMYRIDQPHLLWSLDRIIEGKPANRIQVPKQAADLARLALERMLSLINDQPTTREPALVD